MLILFVDESGDHNLRAIDPNYPVFVLAGCVMDGNCHEKVAREKMEKYKMDLFGRSDIILHTIDIKNRTNGFERLSEKDFRENFYEKTNTLLASLQYKIIACGIKKYELAKKYGSRVLDPYFFSLRILVESLVFEHQSRKQQGPALIVAESRGQELNNLLMRAWPSLIANGTNYVAASEIKTRIWGLVIKDKRDNIPGLQIADLSANPIGRHAIGKRPQKDWEIVTSKFRRVPSRTYLGYGLVVPTWAK